MRAMHATALLLALTLLDATPLKLAVAPMRGGDGATDGMLTMIGEAVTSELRRQKTFDALTYGELKTVLTHEQLSELVGCANASCYADIGSVAGAHALLTGSLGKVGSSWLVNLKVIDVKAVKLVASADRRVKSGKIDDVLDQLPGMVTELVEAASGRMHTTPVPASVAVVSTSSTPPPLPLAGQEVPITDAALVAKLRVVTDGKGLYIAFDPEGRYSGPLFAGDSHGLYRQRLTGGGAEGDVRWDTIFWEPRVTERWRASFEVKQGSASLRCNEQVVPYSAVSETEAKRLLAKIPLFDVRWQRAAVFIARDDTGNYYYVDQALTPEGNSDYRLFVGTKGKVEYLPLNDAINDGESSLFISDRGRFIVRRNGPEAAWAVGDSEKRLTMLNLYQQAPMIYTTLGAYRDQRLATPCDTYLGR